MKILLLGGTGAIGSHLSQICLEKGHFVYLTSRKNRKNKENLTHIKGDAHNIYFLEKILSSNDFDVCVDFMSYKTDEFRSRANMLLSSVGQYVYLSSSRVYANVDDIITERTPRLLEVSDDKSFLQTDEYSLTKARQEDLILESEHTNWTIVRPYITYGENRFQLGVMEKEQWLYRALKGRTVVFSEDISKHLTTLTYGKDVARSIAAICGHPQSKGHIFNITSSESISWKEILDIYCQIIEKFTGHPVTVKYTQESMYLRYASMQYQVKFDRYFDRRFDNTKINQFIDTNNFIPVKTGLAHCLDAFLCKPQFGHFDMRGEVIRDRISHQCASKEEFNSKQKYYLYLILRYLCPISIL